MKKIELADGGDVVVDDDAYWFLNQFNWCSSNGHYAKSRNLYMHRVIVNAKPGEAVDHINGNKRDNRKENLRICTYSANNQNRKILNKRSNYRGVWPNGKKMSASTGKMEKKWCAMIGMGNERFYLGGFENERHAALVYDLWSLDLYGPLGRTNHSVVSFSGHPTKPQ